MKHALLFLAGTIVALSAVAYAQTPPGNVIRATKTVSCAGSPCSGSAPSANTDGASLAQMRAIAIRLCAASGQTLSGAGTLEVYSMDELDELWSIVPELELSVDASAASKRCTIVLSDREMPLGTGRVAVVPSAVTLSGGDLTVTYLRRTKALP